MKQARDQLREIVDKVWHTASVPALKGAPSRSGQIRQLPADHAKPTGQVAIASPGELEQLANALLEPLFPVAKGIRLIGISLSSLAT
jgi:DNA polymerase-4